jgi:hypothetical protein
MDLARPNGDTSLTIDASEKRKWSTVTCASCGQLFFSGDCSLKKPRIFPLLGKRRDAFSGRGRRCQSFSISNRLEIHISTSRPKSHLDHFRSSPSHALMQVMRDLAGQRLRHTFGAAQLQLRISHPILEARILHTSNKPFHKTRLCSTWSLGRLSPSGRLCPFNHRKEVDS